MRTIQIQYARPHWELGFTESDGTSVGVQFDDLIELLEFSDFTEEERHQVLDYITTILREIAEKGDQE